MASKTFKTPGGTELPLMDIKGKPYLSVQHRIMWFREEKNDWSIETEIITTNDKETLAKATIRDSSGRIMATAHKTETKQGFSDHLEKSESSAIGRALGFLGYGTQFALDLEEGDRLADSPVELKKKDVDFKSIPTKKPISDLSKYQVGFSKQKGRSLGDFPLNELTELMDKTENYLNDHADNPPHEMIEFLDVASQFLEQAAMEPLGAPTPKQEIQNEVPATKTQMELLESIASKKGWSKGQFTQNLQEKYGTTNPTATQVEKEIAFLTRNK